MSKFETIYKNNAGLEVFFDKQNFDNVSLIFVQMYEDAPPDRQVVLHPMEKLVESMFNGTPAIDLSSVTFVNVGIKARIIQTVASVVKQRMNLVV